jgi:RNA polymerase sigma factor (sigma-70 family)
MNPPYPDLAHDRLLEHQVFLRQLARSLVADPQRAEDLAQDTAVSALRHAPRAGPMRAWLARVARNLAISAARGERRRADRENAATTLEPQRTPAELEAHFEVQRRVVDAVGRLDEPYKSAILMRYYHDLGPSAIATRLGVPLSTVKSRLARGLAKLRAELDTGDIEGHPAWAAVVLTGLDETHRTFIGSALAAGGAVMGIKLGVCAAAVGAIAGTWWLLRPAVEPSPGVAARETAGAETQLAAVEPPRLRVPSVEAAAPDSLPVPTAEAAPATGLVEASQSSVEIELGRVAETFLSEHPDLDGLDRLLVRLAEDAEVDPHSVATNPETGVVSGKIMFDTSSLGAAFTIDGDRFAFSLDSDFDQTRHDGMLIRSLNVGFHADSAGIARSHTTVQFHPNSHRSSSTFLQQGDEKHAGWSMHFDGSDAKIKPIAMRAHEDGVAWEIGKADTLQPLDNPWAVGLDAAQILYKKLSPLADH